MIAAGIMLRAPSGRILMVRRSKGEDAGGRWALPGGKLHDGESHATAAVRECVKELGWNPGSAGKVLCRRASTMSTTRHFCATWKMSSRHPVQGHPMPGGNRASHNGVLTLGGRLIVAEVPQWAWASVE
jgi:8-oxo-dGTP pyrophosphatase MutT (NUDIX family)